MKSADYVYRVTSVYRRLLDECRSASRAEQEELRRAFSRGFTDGYYTKDHRNMLGVRREEDKDAAASEASGLRRREKGKTTTARRRRRKGPNRRRSGANGERSGAVERTFFDFFRPKRREIARRRAVLPVGGLENSESAVIIRKNAFGVDVFS